MTIPKATTYPAPKLGRFEEEELPAGRRRNYIIYTKYIVSSGISANKRGPVVTSLALPHTTNNAGEWAKPLGTCDAQGTHRMTRPGCNHHHSSTVRGSG